MTPQELAEFQKRVLLENQLEQKRLAEEERQAREQRRREVQI
jgi:hypothetical protein